VHKKNWLCFGTDPLLDHDDTVTDKLNRRMQSLTALVITCMVLVNVNLYSAIVKKSLMH